MIKECPVKLKSLILMGLFITVNGNNLYPMAKEKCIFLMDLIIQVYFSLEYLKAKVD
jgi:hypothetical protein